MGAGQRLLGLLKKINFSFRKRPRLKIVVQKGMSRGGIVHVCPLHFF